MSNDKYILDDSGQPVQEPDLIKWATFFENTANRRVAKTVVGDSTVSTVFLGLDHSFGDGPPVLWETMVIDGPMNDEMDRCSGGRVQAEEMHGKMVERVRAYTQ